MYHYMLLKYIKRKIKPFVVPLLDHYKLAVFKVKWRDNNLHNETVAENIFPIKKVSVGVGTYGGIRAYSFGNDAEYLCIGNYCSIAGEVVFLLGGNHNYKTISTFPFGLKVYGKGSGKGADTKGAIIVEDDVWIGHHALILSGVTLGQGCIIAAGSIVAKNVPAYAIYVNDKVIKYRFSENVVLKLKRFSFDMNNEKLELFSKYYRMEINDNNIDDIMNNFKDQQTSTRLE